LGLFLGGCLAFWVVTAGLGFLLWEDRTLVLGYSATAAGLCLVPSLVTLVWALWGPGRSAEQRRLVVLGGTGIRMFFVLGVGLVLTGSVPYFQQRAFWLWVLAFYLFTLALEMVLVVRTLSPPGRRQPRGTGEQGALAP
jgi:hypothetical protein